MFIDDRRGQLAVGTSSGSVAFSAGSKRAAAGPEHRGDGDHVRDGGRVAPQRDDQADGGHRLGRLAAEHEPLRSSGPPAHRPASPATICAAAMVPITRPEAAAEPVSARTSSGNAIIVAWKPNSDSAWLPHSSR